MTRSSNRFKQHCVVILEILIVIAFVVSISSLHEIIGAHRAFAKAIFTFGWICTTSWYFFRVIGVTLTVIDGNPKNDHNVSIAVLINLIVLHIIFGGMSFMLLWVFNDTKYWSGLPLWDQEWSSLIVLVHMIFTAVLSNGVGFGSYIPINFLTELVYIFVNFTLYLLGLLVISTGVSIAVSNKAKKYERKKKTLSFSEGNVRLHNTHTSEQVCRG